jgi:hypothetical protein
LRYPRIVPSPKPPWSVTYHDGSANCYRIESATDGASFEYIPITPAQSSTGLYSGGDPRSGQLDAAGLEALWQRIRVLESDASIHTEHRGKGTGRFIVSDETGTRTFIVEFGTQLLKEFDAFVAEL